MTEYQRENTDLLVIGIVCIVIATIWPLIYPILGYLLSLIAFAESPGVLKGLFEFGPLYGDTSEQAPAFFKGMAETSERFGGEDPVIAGLPYWGKVNLYLYATIPLYIFLTLDFAVVALIASVSRLIPWSFARISTQSIAILLAMFPYISLLLWSVYFFVLAYIQAWQASVFDFIILIFLCPLVFAKVVYSTFGALMLAIGFVPAGLAFAGKGSLPRRCLEGFFDCFNFL